MVGEIENGIEQSLFGNLLAQAWRRRTCLFSSHVRSWVRENPKTFQFCNFQSAGTVIMRRSVWKCDWLPNPHAPDRHTHTHNANSSATGATGRAGVPSSAQEGMCHTDDHLAYVKLCALNDERVVASVARQCQPLVGQRSCETARCAGNMGAGWAFSVMEIPCGSLRDLLRGLSTSCIAWDRCTWQSASCPSATSEKSQTSLTLEERTPHASWSSLCSFRTPSAATSPA